MSSISFERPEIVVTDLTIYMGVHNEYESNCYTIPVDRLALSQLSNMNAQHGGIVQARRNMLLSTYKSGGLSKTDAMSAFLELIIFGDCYLLKLRNIFGSVVGLTPLMSLYVRAHKNDEEDDITG